MKKLSIFIISTILLAHSLFPIEMLEDELIERKVIHSLFSDTKFVKYFSSFITDGNIWTEHLVFFTDIDNEYQVQFYLSKGNNRLILFVVINMERNEILLMDSSVCSDPAT